MLINWFTVLAQVINFLILVWLLKRFLYKPILRAIDEREKRIATQLAEAEAKKAEAQKECDDFQHKNESFDLERTTLLQKATDEANTERQRLLDEARKDADALRAKRQDALRDEQRDLGQKIIRWTQKEVFAITRKTLTDLAAASLEERITEVFIRRLRAMTGPSKEQIGAALRTSSNPARVHSAVDLPPAQRTAIESAVDETFGSKIQLQFETAPDLVSGVEFACNGLKVAWSIADYLATLEKSSGELLHEDAQPETKPGAKSKLEVDEIALAEPKAAAKAGPKHESKNGFEGVASAAGADH